MKGLCFSLLGVTLLGVCACGDGKPAFSGAASTAGTHAPVAERGMTASEPVSAQRGHPEETPPLIMTLRTRDRTVHVYAGRRYTIEDADGTLIGQLMFEDEFWAMQPQLYYDLHEMFAGDGPWAGHWVGDGEWRGWRPSAVVP